MMNKELKNTLTGERAKTSTNKGWSLFLRRTISK